MSHSDSSGGSNTPKERANVRISTIHGGDEDEKIPALSKFSTVNAPHLLPNVDLKLSPEVNA